MTTTLTAPTHMTAPDGGQQDEALRRATGRTPLNSPDDSIQLAITMISATDHDDRATIEHQLRRYVGQLAGTALPVGCNQPITPITGHHNIADAWRMLGHRLAQTLGIPSTATEFPDTARGILAALDAPITQLTALAAATGQPALVALTHVAAGFATSPTADPTALAHQLIRIADHLTEHHPTDVMTEAARMTLALHTAGSATASRPLLQLMPWPTNGITRGEYALHLNRIAHAAEMEAAQ